jgi:hypothetical protein
MWRIGLPFLAGYSMQGEGHYLEPNGGPQVGWARLDRSGGFSLGDDSFDSGVEPTGRDAAGVVEEAACRSGKQHMHGCGVPVGRFG